MPKKRNAGVAEVKVPYVYGAFDLRQDPKKIL